MTNTMKITGKEAINVNTPSYTGWETKTINLSAGTYAVNIKSDINFNGSSMPLEQVILFNTASVKTGKSESWYSVVDQSRGTQITVEQDEPVYAVVLDQRNITDNTGSLTVTFTEIPSSAS